MEILTFIGKYWLQFLLGLIATGAVGIAKRFRDLYKKEQAHEKEVEQKILTEHIKEEIYSVIKENREESIADDAKIREQFQKLEKEMSILKSGILAIHGNDFKKRCRKLIDQTEKITSEQWDALSADHEVYNSLGGNHEGDRLYKDVEIKYHSQLDD